MNSYSGVGSIAVKERKSKTENESLTPSISQPDLNKLAQSSGTPNGKE